MSEPHIPPGKGTYILTLEVLESVTVRVGAIGDRLFVPGRYLYVGSALGPGGLKARLGRHFSREKKCRWHIDYLVANAEIRGAYYRDDGVRLECAWARWLGRHAEAPVAGLGASDCSCSSHLFCAGDEAAFESLAARIEKELNVDFVTGNRGP